MRPVDELELRRVLLVSEAKVSLARRPGGRAEP